MSCGSTTWTRRLTITSHLCSRFLLALPLLGRIPQNAADPFPPVNLLVPRSVGSLAEGFLADGAGVGFFARVDAAVGDEEKIGVEIFPAVGATVRSPLGVEPLVLQESRDGAETFLATGTLVGFLLRVAPPVSPKGRTIVVALLADGTLEGSLPRMDALVFQ